VSVVGALELGLSALYAFLIWWFLVRPRWPYDWKGTRRAIDLNRRRNKWGDDD
jgi:hypothetical protein